MKALYKMWMNLNYRFCMAEAYLASGRGDNVAVADFLSRASGWERELQMYGRKLV